MLEEVSGHWGWAWRCQKPRLCPGSVCLLPIHQHVKLSATATASGLPAAATLPTLIRH